MDRFSFPDTAPEFFAHHGEEPSLDYSRLVHCTLRCLRFPRLAFALRFVGHFYGLYYCMCMSDIFVYYWSGNINVYRTLVLSNHSPQKTRCSQPWCTFNVSVTLPDRCIQWIWGLAWPRALLCMTAVAACGMVRLCWKHADGNTFVRVGHEFEMYGIVWPCLEEFWILNIL